MAKFWHTRVSLFIASIFFLSACSSQTGVQGISPAEIPSAQPETWSLYAPASTSSIPVMLAAQELENVELTLYTSQEQANTLFARGEVSVLVSGLSVGLGLFRNGLPVQMSASYVSGLSYLVTTDPVVHSFADLGGREVYVPFAGSPIEEVCRHLAAQEGLAWGEEILPVYAPFDSSIALLKDGQAEAVILPEPNVSLVESQPGLYVSAGLYDLWNAAHPGEDGYPQVGVFVNSAWAQTHPDQVNALHAALARAIERVQNDSQGAVEAVSAQFQPPVSVLESALARTQYRLYTGAAMLDWVEAYYRTIGSEMDDESAFFFIAAE